MTNENDVTEADRVAAAAYLSPAVERTADGLVQAFARHRTQAAEAERARVVALRESLGAHIQADAYRDTFPDNDEDAKELRKSETWWRLQARAWLGEDEAWDCSEAAKERALAAPEVQAAFAAARGHLDGGRGEA